jgi:hypothetical protein
MEGKVTTIDGILRVLPEYEITVGQLATTLQRFKSSRTSLTLENQHDQIRKIIDLIINNLKKDSQ